MDNLKDLGSSLHALSVFEVVLRQGSVTRAAEQLGVSQVAVSRIVSRLEQALGTPLLVRSRSGVRATEDGSILLAGVSQGLAAIGQAVDEVRARRQRVQQVSISLSSAFIAYWLMPRYHLFQQALPDINLQFHVISGALRAGGDEQDLALRHSDFTTRSQPGVPFAPEVIIPVCSAAYLQAHGPLERRKPRQPPPVRIELEPTTLDWSAFSQQAGLGSLGGFERLAFSDYALVLQAAMLGRGMALGWLSGVSLALCSGELVPASTNILATGATYSLVSRQRAPRQEVRRVQDWFVQQMQDDLRRLRERFAPLAQVIGELAGD